MSHAKILSSMGLAAILFGTAMNAHADTLTDHPAADSLKTIFAKPVPADFKATGVDRSAYLKLIAGNVDYFKTCQNAAGAIIDPVSKGERQYSTPAFAAAAGLLVKEAGRTDLTEPATRTLTCALTALVNKKAADNHADFYIPLLMHAYRFMKDVVPPEQKSAWETLFKKIDHASTYRADLRGMNWNIVSSSGELLRRHDGLVADDKKDAQFAYLEECLAGHMKTLTPIGLFEDPGSPLAYDAFSRLWLEDVYADNAYEGKLKDQIGTFLRTGGLSTLLMLSPTGEWPVGGRSGMHQWTDAEALAICEINAVQWKKAGRDDVAGAFKRAAHLAYQSMARWQRPSGELFIIKNRAEPAKRLAYEGYSNHSQYNLLPMAMLAIAYSRADETIVEKPTPSEIGGYVFDARPTFHKIFAAAAGYYAEIDTAGDPHYNATGLQRVHRAGVTMPALTDSSANDRGFGDKKGPKAGLALGLAWNPGDDKTKWLGLADFAHEGGKPVAAADLSVDSATSDKAAFTVIYKLGGKDGDGKTVTEQYALSSNGVELTAKASGITGPLAVRWPVLVNDGAKNTIVNTSANSVGVTFDNSTTLVTFPAGMLAGPIIVTGPRIEHHSGYVQAATAPLADDTLKATITLEQK
ncbi:MAG: hypothetical protein QM754_19600 [Tepidisphaeraceae bacterium]